MFNENETKLFADDSKIISKIREQMDNESLKNDLYTVDDWCGTWVMRLNVESANLFTLGNQIQKQFIA